MTNESFHPNLLPDRSELTLRRTFRTDQGWVVEADGQNAAVCPDCQTLSRSRHSRYWRCLQDLPVQGTPVLLRLRLGRWRCRNPDCPRRIFTERLAAVCAPNAQQTQRFEQIIGAVAHALGGRPGRRLMGRLGLPVSADTLLRHLKTAARHSVASHAFRVVGVDDWAWRKGQSFGTVLVDLERGEVVDLLATRSADALAEWLEQHPEVSVVSRDRQGLYAEGARRGAPQALQVADRFHLVCNLTQAVERALALQRPHLRMAAPSASPSPPSPISEVKPHPKPIRVHCPVLKQQREAARQRRQQKLELFQTVKQLQAAGLNVAQIARQLGLCRRRLDRWVRLEQLPERSRMQPRPGMPEAFRDHLRWRWEAGCHHGPTLLAEIRKRGYTGCYSGLAKLLSPWRQPQAENAQVVAPGADELPLEATAGMSSRQISPQRAAALLAKPRCELTDSQAALVDTLKQQCPGFALMRTLVLSFRTLVRVGKPATLHRWMQRAKQTGIDALVRFVQTLKQDLGAVEAAVGTRWSNGPVEGHINRLKMLKRQMYGRAGIELLRARLRPEPAFGSL
jgi:transposase